MWEVIKQGIKGVATNPIAILILAVTVSMAMFYGSSLFIADQLSPAAKALSGIATAILTTGTFGALFEFVNKKRLIREVVLDAVGQTRSLELGLSDVKIKVTEIEYRKSIINSNKLIIGSRYSSSFLDRHKDEIRERLVKRGKSIEVLHMRDASIFPSTKGIVSTPEQFFRGMQKYDADACKNVSLLQTEEKLCYNFVQVDEGIWLKMYFNAPQPDMPPAFFLKEGSPLFLSIERDISLLFSKGKALQW
ncbi:hypothetical protein FG91_01249 [Sphingopyxis sp. LC81]|uniref:hypothetical protein n=1 Tax=Sphingopyxis sp. LC81 TaxID=1502850 RepID=UPI00050DFAA2|nr:hypothetical protein [Sphingopyxis sp. LC81]KGB55331.1 hypothetical protein FG91_01249 [Sphingopyxis sp. LC81]